MRFFSSMKTSLKRNGLQYTNYLWFSFISFHHVIVTSTVFVGYAAFIIE